MNYDPKLTLFNPKIHCEWSFLQNLIPQPY